MSMVKELKKQGFRKGYPVPLGFEADLERIKKELGDELLAWEVVKSEDDTPPRVTGEYLVRYLGFTHKRWHYFFVGKLNVAND